jgi:predicted RNA-binding Zn-ribbon protein involved in translation (DUF1610 family)
MDHQFCPGSKFLRQPKPEIFTCPSCGDEVEIWSDELKGRCPSCGRTVMKDKVMSCLDWCAYGKDCVGEETYNKYQQNRAVGIRETLLKEMKKQLADQQEIISRTLETLGELEEFLLKEEGDWHILVPACILKDLEPDTVRSVLFKTGLQKDDIDAVCEIIIRYQDWSHPGSNRNGESDFQLLMNAEKQVIPAQP